MNSFETFNELNIPSSLKQSLVAMSFLKPTPIQASAIPAGLEGKDVVGTAQTGTGKTAAFGIPLLSSLYANHGKQGLILCPTRELAAQIFKVLKTMGRGSSLRGALVVGGESFFRQRNELEDGVDWIVATPGRLNDHLNEGTVDLSAVNVLILDEVDRMLDMGFLPQIRSVIQRVPTQRQTLLFSATLPNEVARFVDPLVKNAVRISVGSTVAPTTQVTENVVRLRSEEKTQKLLALLAEKKEGKALVFVRTQNRTYRLMRTLEQSRIAAVCLHGGRTQAQRKNALALFRNGSHPVMVATDLAGRGLDVADIDHVINFDVPMTREDYIHRIGRTGRAGNTGTATSFVLIGDHEEEAIVTGKKAERPKPAPSARPHSGPKRHGGQNRWRRPQGGGHKAASGKFRH